jgi:hypothetical protein
MTALAAMIVSFLTLNPYVAPESGIEGASNRTGEKCNLAEQVELSISV